MQKFRKLLPKALYALGWLCILLGIIRFVQGFTNGYWGMPVSSTMLNYISAVLGTVGTALLYMAAARAIELLEKRDGNGDAKTL